MRSQSWMYESNIQVNCFSSNFVCRSILCTFVVGISPMLSLFMRTTRIWKIWKEITMIKYVQLRERSLLKHATSMIFQCFVPFFFFCVLLFIWVVLLLFVWRLIDCSIPSFECIFPGCERLLTLQKRLFCCCCPNQMRYRSPSPFNCS